MNKIPVSGLVLLVGIDRFLNEARAITNLIGNGVATIAVAKWEGALDLKQTERAFSASGAGLTPEEFMPAALSAAIAPPA
jgi:DAACS family dicarboxylate/amino acid:cation (Na+ or H+) symporter/aerobic C4-dicarboxylate transport protein